jgi:exopolysaccharide production protein ExoZ
VVIPMTSRQLLLSGGSMLLLMGLTAEEKRRRLIIPTFICKLGDASYSVYLVHYPALSVLCKIAKSLSLETRVPHQLLFLGTSAASIVMGMFFARLVELPLRRWKQPRKPTDKVVATPLKERRLAA